MGGTAIAFQADVGDSAAVERMIKRTMDEFSRVDILVNNAGVLQGGGSLLDLKDEELDRMVQVNVKGVIYCTKAVVPGMMKRHQGKIVNLASVAGLGTASLPGNLVYSSTKAAVIALTKRIALELGQYGVNVNAVAPGLIRTDMGMGYRPADEQKERIQYFKERSILGRIGEPEDIANAILFLSSAESDFITGQVITVDGGRTDFLSHSFLRKCALKKLREPERTVDS